MSTRSPSSESSFRAAVLQSGEEDSRTKVYRFDGSRLRRLAEVCDVYGTCRGGAGADRQAAHQNRLITATSNRADGGVGGGGGEATATVVVQPVVVAMCGSFNPIHNAHLAVYEAAKRKLESCDTTTVNGRHYAVLGGFLSPVNDAYSKPGLLPLAQRVEIIHAALRNHRELAVDEWEGLQANYTRTFFVLRHLQETVQQWYAAQEPELVAALAAQNIFVRVVFVCGADLFSTFFVPGCWPLDSLRNLLDSFTVVVISRVGPKYINNETDLRRQIQQGPLREVINGVEYALDLSKYVFLFTSLYIADDISSTMIRHSLARIYSKDKRLHGTGSSNSLRSSNNSSFGSVKSAGCGGGGRSCKTHTSLYEQARCSIAAMVPADAVDFIVRVYAHS